MASIFSIRNNRSGVISALLIIASALLLLGKAHIIHADPPSPNVAVFQIDPTHGDDAFHTHSTFLGWYAPATTTPLDGLPGGRYVTPNGHFAIGPASNGWKVWNVQTGTVAASIAFDSTAFTPTSMAVSPNGTYAAITSLATDGPSWEAVIYNLAANTQFRFEGIASSSPVPPTTPAFQLEPQIIGWTGDESAMIFSTGVPFSDAPTSLFYKMSMTGITFGAPGAPFAPVPPITTLGADQQITDLVFSPDSTKAAFLYEDPSNTPANFAPLTAGPGPGGALPPNGLKVIDLVSGLVTPIGEASAGQGLTAPAWAPDDSKLYFGAGPFQNTPFPVNVHLFTYDFTSHAITLGDALIASDPAHIGVSTMQVCADQVFMREISVVPASSPTTSATIAGRITSAAMTSLGTHSPVYTTNENALGPCIPVVTASGGGGSIPSIPTLAISAPTAYLSPTPAAPITCILAPHLTVGGMGIVTPGSPNNLRSTPTISSSLVGQIPGGQTFNVLGGPFCDTTSGYVYWQVSYNGTTAYTAEGKTTYLVLPYTPGLPTPTTLPPTPTLLVINLTAIHLLLPTATPTLIPGTCVNGFVWREAIPSDHVCVLPATRSQTAADNAAAASRVNPAGAYGPNTCINGYVWREAYSGDVVCVTVATRSQAAADNAAAASRVAH